MSFVMSVATAAVVAITGIAGVAGIATAIVGTEKNNDDQKDDPAIVTEKVHLFPSLRALTSYYADSVFVFKKDKL